MKFFRSLLVLVAAVVAPTPANAKLFQLYAQGHGGYSAGSGEEEATTVAGFADLVPTRQDFYKLVSGPAFGAEVGITLVGIDLCADYLKFLDGGSMTKIVLGMRLNFDPGDDGDFTLFLRAGGGAMIATYGDTSPFTAEVGETPLGFTARGGLGISYELGGPFEIGPQFDIGYYRLLNGTIAPTAQDIAEIEAQIEANCGTEDRECAEQQYQQAAATQGVGYEVSKGIDWSVLLALRAAIGF